MTAHYSERIADLQAICLSSPVEDWRPSIAEYMTKLNEEERDLLIRCLMRQVRRETKLLASKKAVLTILTKPKITKNTEITAKGL